MPDLRAAFGLCLRGLAGFQMTDHEELPQVWKMIFPVYADLGFF
jgi:hypothetical protein